MKPPRGRLEDLIARFGAGPCKAYAAVLRERTASYLEARQLDPESILILNLTIREGALATMAPDHDCSSWLFIAPDSNGNYYFVDAHANPTAVKLLEHDPPGILDTGFTLAELTNTTCVQPLEPIGLHMTICRADHPRRSILDPISIEEWTAVAGQHEQIEVTGFRKGQNPFTGELLKFRAKGGAYIQWNGAEIFAELLLGRIHFGKAPPDFVQMARKLAQSLRAQLFPVG